MTFNSNLDLSNDSIRNDILNSLPSVLSQSAGSNNQKLLNGISDMAISVKDNLLNVYLFRQISNASGKQLDTIANDYGISRIDNDDEFLRFMIRVQLLQNRVSSTTNDLKRLIAFVLNIDIKHFDFEQTANPEEIKIVNIPFDFVSGSKESIKRFILAEKIQSVLPPEYKLLDINYSKDDLQQINYAITSNINLMKGAY